MSVRAPSRDARPLSSGECANVACQRPAVREVDVLEFDSMDAPAGRPPMTFRVRLCDPCARIVDA